MDISKNGKQRKISVWLKGLCIVVGIMITAYFAMKIWISTRDIGLYPGWQIYAGIGLSGLVLVMCGLILRRFWKVCTEIGNDNSFSLENVENFKRMALIGGICMAQYLVRTIIVLTADAELAIFRLVILVGLVLLSGIFVVLCEALSQLIRNAYEVKHENDLTI